MGVACDRGVNGSASHFISRPESEGYQPMIGRQDLSVDMTAHGITSAQEHGIGWLRLRPPRTGGLRVGKRRITCDGKDKAIVGEYVLKEPKT